MIARSDPTIIREKYRNGEKRRGREKQINRFMSNRFHVMGDNWLVIPLSFSLSLIFMRWREIFCSFG